MLTCVLPLDDPMTFQIIVPCIKLKSSKPCVPRCFVQAKFSTVLAHAHDQMPLTNGGWQPELDHQQLKNCPRKHEWPRGVLRCVYQGEMRVGPLVGGQQVDV